MRRARAHRRPIENLIRQCAALTGALQPLKIIWWVGGCQALDSKSDPLLLSPATDPAFAARYIIARRTALTRLRFI